MCHYILIGRYCLGDDLHVSLADIEAPTASKFTSKYSTDLHSFKDVVHMFMNMPLWKSWQKAYWNKVPTIQQTETECGAQTVLHTYIFHKSVSQHRCLLLLHKLNKNVLLNLNLMSRVWHSKILLPGTHLWTCICGNQDRRLIGTKYQQYNELKQSVVPERFYTLTYFTKVCLGIIACCL
jgi:hypothetical protein